MCGQWGYLSVPDSGYDNYVYKLFSTCGPNANWLIRECGVGTKTSPNAGAGVGWTDWAPKQDTTGGCRTISLSLNISAFTVGGNFQNCEENDITKEATAPNFKSAWKFGGTAGGTTANRSPALQIGVRWPTERAADIGVEQWIQPVRPR